MSLHLRPIPEIPRIKADTRALRMNREAIRADLEQAKAEKQYEPKHYRRVRETQAYRQNGGA